MRTCGGLGGRAPFKIRLWNVQLKKPLEKNRIKCMHHGSHVIHSPKAVRARLEIMGGWLAGTASLLLYVIKCSTLHIFRFFVFEVSSQVRFRAPHFGSWEDHLVRGLPWKVGFRNRAQGEKKIHLKMLKHAWNEQMWAEIRMRVVTYLN
jgi:hypothetical protein